MAASSYRSLANEDVQTARATIKVPFTNRSLHDYVPLYFGFKTPMVAWNQTQNEHMIFLRFSLDILSQGGVVISDGNARSTATRFFSFTNIDDLAQLDASAINTVKYARDTELKRRKQAEILVPDFLAISECIDIIVFSMTSAATVLAILGRFGIKKAVRVNPGLYFGTATPKSDV